MAEQRNALYVEGRDNPVMRTLELKPTDSADRLDLLNVTPADMPKTNPLAPTNVNDMNVSESAAGLYVDPTPAYQPAIDFIQQQRGMANERYAQNKADLANIFGNLTQVNKESQARVQSQFEKSIADQQMATAQRMAQARAGAEGTQRAAIRAMDERGGGPMGNLQASPAAVAAERGIADIGAYSTIWEGMQGAIGQQTQQNIQANLAALGQTEVQANQQLQRSLEDTLNQLSGQETGVRSDLAGAIVGQKSKVAEANYNEILAKQAAAEAARLAAIRGAYDVQQAEIEAAAKLEKAQFDAQNRVTNYPETSAGASQYLRNRLMSSRNLTPEQADGAVGRFWASIDAAEYDNARNADEAYSLWRNSQGGATIEPEAIEAARLFFNGLRYTGPDELGVMPSANLGNFNPLDYMPPSAGVGQ